MTECSLAYRSSKTTKRKAEVAAYAAADLAVGAGRPESREDANVRAFLSAFNAAPNFLIVGKPNTLDPSEEIAQGSTAIDVVNAMRRVARASKIDFDHVTGLRLMKQKGGSMFRYPIAVLNTGS